MKSRVPVSLTIEGHVAWAVPADVTVNVMGKAHPYTTFKDLSR